MSQMLLLTTILSEGQHGEWSALPFGSHESALMLNPLQRPSLFLHQVSNWRF